MRADQALQENATATSDTVNLRSDIIKDLLGLGGEGMMLIATGFLTASSRTERYLNGPIV